MAPQAPYSPASPWMSIDDLGQYMDQAAPNASYDPSIQTTINGQVNQANASEAPSAPPPPADDGIPDWMKNLGLGTAKIPGGSRPLDTSMIDKLIANMRDSGASQHDAAQAAIDRVNAYRNNMPTGPAGPNLAGFASLADAWGNDKSNLAGAYKAPQTPQEREDAKMKVDQELSKMLGDQAKNDQGNAREQLTGEVAKLHYAQARSDANDAKVAAQDEKAKQTYIDKIDTDLRQGRLGPAVAAQTRLNAAGAIETLLKNAPGGNLNNIAPTQVDEVAQSLNTLLSTGGSPNVTLFNHLVPSNVERSYAGIKQWLESKPVEANQGDFLKNFADLTAREKAYNQGIISEAIKNRATATGSLGWAKRDPQAFKQITESFLNRGALQNNSPKFDENNQLVQPAGSTQVTAPAAATTAFKAGDIRQGPDGKNYQRDANGQWRPL